MTTLWAAFALMTGAAVFVVLAALARGRAAADGAEADAAVYRDQIDEIGRDRDRGLIDEAEAESARAEVARRLFAASDRAGRETTSASATRRRIAAAAALVLVPAISLGAYAKLGSPDLPDLPLAARKDEAPDAKNLADLAARVELALAKNPNDGRGWSVVAPVYMRLGRPEDAARAYRSAIALLGSTPDREADLGEALFAAADGVVTADAREAFERSVRGDEPSLKGSVYLARAAEQDGDIGGAVSRLKKLLAAAEPEAPYLEALKDEFQRLAGAPAMPMPSAEEAEKLKTPEDRMARIRGMVDRLDARLAETGGDLGEWMRLVKARVALGDLDRAKAALGAARAKFGSDGRAKERLEALSLGLGLESGA